MGKKMKNLTMFFLSLILQIPLAFGGAGGHGGDGIKINGNLYLLDLAEAGVEKNPYFKNITPPEFIIEELVNKFHGHHDIPIDLVATKLAEISLIYPSLARHLLATIVKFDWVWVNHELINVKDEDSSLDYAPESLSQIAIRRGITIRVSQTSWSLLDNGNKAALIIHEAVYALSVPRRYNVALHNGEFAYEWAQISHFVRDFVGYIFKGDFSKHREPLLKSLALNVFASALLIQPYIVRKNDDIHSMKEGARFLSSIRLGLSSKQINDDFDLDVNVLFSRIDVAEEIELSCSRLKNRSYSRIEISRLSTYDYKTRYSELVTKYLFKIFHGRYDRTKPFFASDLVELYQSEVIGLSYVKNDQTINNSYTFNYDNCEKIMMSFYENEIKPILSTQYQVIDK